MHQKYNHNIQFIDFMQHATAEGQPIVVQAVHSTSLVWISEYVGHMPSFLICSLFRAA